jgi:hypothetical protein
MSDDDICGCGHPASLHRDNGYCRGHHADEGRDCYCCAFWRKGPDGRRIWIEIDSATQDASAERAPTTPQERSAEQTDTQLASNSHSTNDFSPPQEPT